MPVAQQQNLELQEYNPGKNEVIDEIVASNMGKTILVVGHSNTIPRYANQLLGEERYQDLTEMEYDKVFVVTLATGQPAKVILLGY